MNDRLARYLREHPNSHEQPPTSAASSLSYRGRHWRIRDRLSEQDIANIIRAFKAGTPKHELAKHYGINLRSLKKLLREEGVKRKSWNDIQL